VHWSPSSRTALAEAELEYPENHVSKSIYVGFPVTAVAGAAVADRLAPHLGKLQVAIWTTTPWTIPANLAVAVNGGLEYALVTHPSLGGRVFIVAKELASRLGTKVFGLPEGEALQVLDSFKGRELVGLQYRHPLFDRTSPLLEGGDYITTESGTGLVHTAPGHGQEDYMTGMKNGLPLLSPVDDAGRWGQRLHAGLMAGSLMGGPPP
jgi:isoleucyl-tRNA synthetase